MTKAIRYQLALVLCLIALTGIRADGLGGLTSVLSSALNNEDNSASLIQKSSSSAAASTEAAMIVHHTTETAQDAPLLAIPAIPAIPALPTLPVLPAVSLPEVPAIIPPVQPGCLLDLLFADIHFIAGQNLSNAFVGYHRCNNLKNMTQCAIYDSMGSDAVLRGVEMIVPESVFQTFSDDEKALWHSHAFPVESGILCMPNLSPAEELLNLQSLIGTYGKATNLYHAGLDQPIGGAQTAFGITNQGQLDLVSSLADLINSVLGLKTDLVGRALTRQVLTAPDVVQGQDPFHQTGLIPQYNTIMSVVNKTTAQPL